MRIEQVHMMFVSAAILYGLQILSLANAINQIDQETCEQTNGSDRTCESNGSSLDDACLDLEENCSAYAGGSLDDIESSCYQESYYMFVRCKAACDACSFSNYVDYYNLIVQPKLGLGCADYDESCSDWADTGECTNNPEYMMDNCPFSCDICIPMMESVPQKLIVGDEYESEDIDDQESKNELQHLLQDHYEKMLTYQESIAEDDRYIKVRNSCVNSQPDCVFWAATGECDLDKHFGYMMTNCPLACLSCEMMDINLRCPMPESLDEGDIKAGDIDTMFKSLVQGEYGPVTVHSAPSHYDSIENIQANDSYMKSDGPWVLTIDNFLTPEEAAQMIVLGYESGYKRSTDVGEKKVDGSYAHEQSESRTSENAWCTDACLENPVVQRISEKIINITGIPLPNHEHFQILKYEKDQFYESHHDYINHHVRRPCGPRVLTFFLYLSDVEEGGGTQFTDLNITIQPKVGRALLWPSVLSDDVLGFEPNTHHEALPVIKGTKYAANSWLHLRNFRDFVDLGCV